VSAYVEQLRARAEHARRGDPFAKPFNPTEVGALGKCSQLTREAYDRLVASGMAQKEARAVSRAEGAAGALRWLAERAVQADHENQRQDQESERAHKRHWQGAVAFVEEELSRRPTRHASLSRRRSAPRSGRALER